MHLIRTRSGVVHYTYTFSVHCLTSFILHIHFVKSCAAGNRAHIRVGNLGFSLSPLPIMHDLLLPASRTRHQCHQPVHQYILILLVLHADMKCKCCALSSRSNSVHLICSNNFVFCDHARTSVNLTATQITIVAKC